MNTALPPIDHLIITAASRAQARGYRAMLRPRAARLRAHAVRSCLVIPDPKDRRAGSGNATLLTLARTIASLARHRPGASIRDLLADQRILIIHCGGDSRRLPAYAAIGKLFLPLDRRTSDGSPADMFDLILSDLAAILRRSPPTTLIASGDVLLNASVHPIDLSARGITGVAFPADIETASRHGVYALAPIATVHRFLQKPSHATLKREQALLSDGRALVDSGLVAMCSGTVDRVLHAAGLSVHRKDIALTGHLADASRADAPPLDLYEHILMAAAGAHIGPSRLRAALHRTPFHCRTIPSCDFLHVGTTSQLLGIAASDPRLRDGAPDSRAPVILASSGHAHIKPAPRVWIDACRFSARVTLPGDNILVGVETDSPLTLPRRWGLTIIPIGPRRFVPIAFGLTDDFKSDVNAGATLGCRPFAPLVNSLGGSESLWPDHASDPASARTLFNSRLWPVASSRSRALDLIRWLWSAAPRPTPRPSKAWLTSDRISLAEAILGCDRALLLAHRSALARRHATESCQRHITAARRETSLSRRASHLWIASEFDADLGHDPAPRQSLALRAVAGAVDRSTRSIPTPLRSTPAEPIHIDQSSLASAPARIDLAGGWSDTPPICHDLGGAVVNLAVSVNNTHALRAVVRRTSRPGIVISSTDLSRSIRIRDLADLSPPFDPTRWSSLACAALHLSVPSARNARSLDIITERFWSGSPGSSTTRGGIHITTSSLLPKGSGLGTSSILAATLLAALANARGERPTLSTLFARTLSLEQHLGTGGGWQDQVGGLTPGFKVVRTAPGDNQIPTHTPLPAPSLSTSGGPTPLLYFTGVRRMARGILRGVVGSYLSRRSDTLRIIRDLKSGAEAMADALHHHDTDEFIRRLNEYWSLKRAIDPGASLPAAESFVQSHAHAHAHDILAWELPGAGGGGYLFLLARDSRAATRIRRALLTRPFSSAAGFATIDADPSGLRIEPRA